MAEQNVEQAREAVRQALTGLGVPDRVWASALLVFEIRMNDLEKAVAAEAIRDLLTGEPKGPWGIEHAGPHLTEQQARAVANALNALAALLERQ